MRVCIIILANILVNHIVPEQSTKGIVLLFSAFLGIAIAQDILECIKTWK